MTLAAWSHHGAKPIERVLARATLAKLELTNGRWRAASAELDSAARLDPGTALEHRI
jgi:hypothetical protein